MNRCPRGGRCCGIGRHGVKLHVQVGLVVGIVTLVAYFLLREEPELLADAAVVVPLAEEDTSSTTPTDNSSRTATMFHTTTNTTTNNTTRANQQQQQQHMHHDTTSSKHNTTTVAAAVAVVVVNQNQTSSSSSSRGDPMKEQNPDGEDQHPSSVLVDMDTCEQWKTHANQALHAMLQEQHIFDTAVTHQDVVLSKGFPRPWFPCTLPQLVRQKQTDESNTASSSSSSRSSSIHITILGGSLSSASAKACKTSHEDWLSGRYSNILQTSLNNHNNNNNINQTDTIHYQVSNMAQGGMDSVWTGLHLDSLLALEETDVIVWAFAVNDHHRNDNFHPQLKPQQQQQSSAWSFTAQQQVQRLDFFLRRLYSLYYTRNVRDTIPPPQQSATTTVQLPPILLLYTWDYGIGNKPAQDIGTQGLDATPLQSAWALIDDYRTRLGWNIQVLHVGATVDPALFAQDPSVLLDDLHHAGCLGVHLIAHMLQYALYKDIATCDIKTLLGNSNTSDLNHSSRRYPLPPSTTRTDSPRNSTNNSTNIMAPTAATTTVAPLPTLSELDSLLFNESTPMGSLTPWVPNTGISSLRFGETASDHNLTTTTTTATTTTKPHHQLDQFLQNFFPQGAAVTRADRKFSYSLPLCSASAKTTVAGSNTTSESFQDASPEWKLILLEPTELRWLGLDLSDTSVILTIEHPQSTLGDNYGNVDDTVVTTIPVTANAKQFSSLDWILTWVNVTEELLRTTANTTTTAASPGPWSAQSNFLYSLALCKTDPDKDVFLHGLVAVMAAAAG